MPFQIMPITMKVYDPGVFHYTSTQITYMAQKRQNENDLNKTKNKALFSSILTLCIIYLKLQKSIFPINFWWYSVLLWIYYN